SLLLPPLPSTTSTPFPYTTLFRSSRCRSPEWQPFGRRDKRIRARNRHCHSIHKRPDHREQMNADSRLLRCSRSSSRASHHHRRTTSGRFAKRKCAEPRLINSNRREFYLNTCAIFIRIRKTRIVVDKTPEINNETNVRVSSNCRY